MIARLLLAALKTRCTEFIDSKTAGTNRNQSPLVVGALKPRPLG